MADETANRLLVRIEATQAKFEKQMAVIARSAAKGAGDIERSFKKANDNAAASVGATRAAVSNLSFQLNDIAQGLASGTSPFTIMIQQGSQVAQALQGAGGGLIGAVKTLGGALAQMVNPVSLASFALIGAVGAAVQYFSTVTSETKGADELIKGHAEFIRQIKDAYGEAAIGAEQYSTTSRKILEYETRDKIQDFKTALTSAASELSGQLTSLSVDSFQGATFTIGEINGAINKLNDSVAAGNPDIKTFIERLIEIAEQPGTPQQIRDVIKEIVESGKVSVEAQQKLAQLTTFINQVGDAAGNQVGQVNGLSKAISTLANVALPALSDMEQATKAYEEGLKGATTVEERLQLGKAFGDAQRRIQASMMPVPADKPNRESEETEKPTKPKKSAEDRSREKEAREAERESESIQKLIDNLQFERSIMGLTGVEREKAIALRRAEKGATEEQKLQIAGLIESNYAEKQALEDTARAMEEIRDIGRDALGGFVSDLLDGKSAADALSDALKRVGDRLLNSGLDALFGTGGSGGGLGIFGALFGGGSSGASDPWSGLRLPGFASGTSNAPGGLALVGERGPEIVNLPKGSQVIPNAPSMKALGRGGAVNVTYAPQNNFQGTSEELAQFRREQLKDKQEFSARVIATVRKANDSRVKLGR